MSKPDGGNAFPNTTVTFLQSDGEDMVTAQGGMSLRDYFAAKAMQGMAASEYWSENFQPDNDTYQMVVAETAYQVADAMLKAREL
jgi:hypothetical protein